jgi:hypothetical protein
MSSFCLLLLSLLLRYMCCSTGRLGWYPGREMGVKVTLVLRHFVAADVYDSMCELAVSIGEEKPGGHRNTAERSAGELYAGELYDMFKDITAKKALPRIVVSSLALPMVPLATLITRDEVSISARLDSMETGLKKLTESVNSINFGGARPKQPGLTVTLAPVVQPGHGAGHTAGTHGQAVPEQGQPGLGQTGGVQEAGQTGHHGGQLGVPGETTSFADIAAGRGVSGQGGGRQARQRVGSIGAQQKREREEGGGDGQFKTVPPRRKRPVNHGSSTVVIEEAGQAAPVEIYIGNTTPAATEGIVEAVLMKCAKGLDAQTEFKVLEVVQLAKQIEKPRTKCWKVVIPYKFKDMMEKDELYPPGWCHRKFFSPRQTANPAKQARKDDGIVQEVIQEQQRKEEANRQVVDDLQVDEEQTVGSGPGQEGAASAPPVSSAEQ